MIVFEFVGKHFLNMCFQFLFDKCRPYSQDSFNYRFLAVIEFFVGTKSQSEELGTTWMSEIREELRFAMLCYGSSKVN